MKFVVDGEQILELNETKKKVIGNDIHEDQLNQDLKRRVGYIVTHKYEQCLKRLKSEWMPKLKAKGVQNVPLDDDQFAELVFQQPEYKSRKQRDLDG